MGHTTHLFRRFPMNSCRPIRAKTLKQNTVKIITSDSFFTDWMRAPTIVFRPKETEPPKQSQLKVLPTFPSLPLSPTSKSPIESLLKYGHCIFAHRIRISRWNCQFTEVSISKLIILLEKKLLLLARGSFLSGCTFLPKAFTHTNPSFQMFHPSLALPSNSSFPFWSQWKHCPGSLPAFPTRLPLLPLLPP